MKFIVVCQHVQNCFDDASFQLKLRQVKSIKQCSITIRALKYFKLRYYIHWVYFFLHLHTIRFI